MISNARWSPLVILDGKSVQLSIREFARATAKAMSAAGVLDDYIESTTEEKIRWAEQNMQSVIVHVDCRSWQERFLDSWIATLDEWKLFYKAKRIAEIEK